VADKRALIVGLFRIVTALTYTTGLIRSGP
jgi:hypothetical protein